VDWTDDIASESVLHLAYAWLSERRLEYSPNDDVWDVRWRWEEILPQLQARLRAGAYRLGPVRRFHHGDETIEVCRNAQPTQRVLPRSDELTTRLLAAQPLRRTPSRAMKRATRA
jgi:hypothetical protein